MAAEKEGGATQKRIKITKAQRTLFIFVCGASLVLGVTAVLVIYFAKSIAFENKLIKQKEYVVEALKKDQDSLAGMSAQIDELRSNVSLESVPTSRDNGADCSNFDYAKTSLVENPTEEQVEMLRLCSPLRVVSDALPSTSETISVDDIDATTRVQIDKILENAGIDLITNEGNGLSIDDAGNSSNDSSDSSVDGLIEPYSTLNIGINIDGDMGGLKSFLSTIDKSIRNFDLRSATFEVSEAGALNFTGDYHAYYTNPVNLDVLQRRICADKDNKACTDKGGDQSVEKGQGGATSNSTTAAE